LKIMEISNTYMACRKIIVRRIPKSPIFMEYLCHAKGTVVVVRDCHRSEKRFRVAPPN
jgi:hypothetical protein